LLFNYVARIGKRPRMGLFPRVAAFCFLPKIMEGRVKKSRSFNLKFRVTDFERTAMEQLAGLEGLSYSEALRLIIREACRNRGLWPPTNTALKVEGGAK
jgi:hypothetical protein